MARYFSSAVFQFRRTMAADHFAMSFVLCFGSRFMFPFLRTMPHPGQGSGRVAAEITTCVRVDEPFWVRGKDGVGHWVQLSGRLRQRDATIFLWEHLYFVAHSPASEDAPLEAFDWNEKQWGRGWCDFYAKLAQ